MSEGSPITIDKSVVGADGNGIEAVTLTTDFCLVFNYTDGTKSGKIGPIKGEKGADGTNGTNGTDGLTPILTLDGSGNLFVKYGESGTATNLGNIKGQKGDTGEQGTKGDKGDNGTDGINGVDGKSAYELYKAAHPEYTGTQEEWLSTLKGEKGDTGRGIAKTEIIDGHLWITYTDDLTNPTDVGFVTNKDESKTEITPFTYTELEDGTYRVALNSVFKESIATVVIPETFNGKAVTELRGFSGVTNLSKVVIPDSIKVIGGYAFRDCKKLKEINLSSGLTKIDTGAFYDCVSLQTITIPNTVTYIGVEAFKGCTLIQSITIPSSVTYIGKNPFRESGLTKATFEDPIGWKTAYNTSDGKISVVKRYSQSDMSDENKAAQLLCDTNSYYLIKNED